VGGCVRQYQLFGETTASNTSCAAEAIGWDRLGVKKGDFGTHSIDSGAAMAMYLDEIPIYTIMMIGDK
jgi:hypothetical protein